MLRQSNRMLYQQSDAFDIFIADSASIMFAKTNGSTVRLNTLYAIRYIYCIFFLNYVCQMDRILDAFNIFIE